MEKKASGSGGGDAEVRKGPWTMEEDLILINYIANHGEGVWNSLAKAAGLKRTGKSCRLRWLNYLRPDVRRGNITPEEQLIIMELHAKWGNRWSKIAKHLPGRTDNEIKNFWRTRIQKYIKQAETTSSSVGSHQSSEINDQASTSASQCQFFGTPEAVETYSPTTSYQANMDISYNNYHPSSTSPPEMPMPMPMSMPMPTPMQLPIDQSSESLWSMDDLWSMQLLNSDKLIN